ncbi:unnamed protein product [Oppiella nova]|uniref:Uncharacterized protein n=1 Tax=Oppiella nova TaxID=334625 RepID=A0A7R9M9V0_9ACAR|nr:unnamed protein product [Oppiella nova]CAG2173482.1 unnamed protein product [Oppiella nova]
MNNWKPIHDINMKNSVTGNSETYGLLIGMWLTPKPSTIALEKTVPIEHFIAPEVDESETIAGHPLEIWDQKRVNRRRVGGRRSSCPPYSSQSYLFSSFRRPFGRRGRALSPRKVREVETQIPLHSQPVLPEVRISPVVSDPIAHVSEGNAHETIIGSEIQLLNDLYGMLGIPDGIPDSARIRIDLVVVTSRRRLIAEEVDLIEVLLHESQAICFVPTHESQAIGFVPTLRETVETDLSADGVAEVQLLTEPGVQCVHKLLADVVFGVIGGELLPLPLRTAPAHRTYVDQTVAELDEVSAFDRQFHFRHIPQTEVDERLEFLFAHELRDRLRGQQRALLVGHQTVLSEHVVVSVDDCVRRLRAVLTRAAHLFRNLRQVGAAHQSYRHSRAKIFQELFHLWADPQSRWRQSAVDVEQHQCLRVVHRR